MTRQMHLNLFIQSRGHHEASWRHRASSKLPLTDIRYTVDLAQKAEAGLFDSIFLADVLGLWNDVEKTPFNWLEPVTTLAALAMATEPHRADRDRIDHLHRALQPRPAILPRSTTSAVAASAGTSSPPGRRKPAATSAASVRSATATATSGPRSTWPWSGGSGIAGPTAPCSTIAPAAATPTPSCVRPIEHAGPFYKVKGPLNLPRSPQGRPVFVQAGSSDTGRRFAARHAEAVFTAHLEKATAQGVLCRLEVAGDGSGPQCRRGPDPAGLQPGDRLHRGRGAPLRRRAQ